MTPDDAPTGRDDLLPSGPVARSIGTAFRVLYAAVGLLAAGWAISNVRQVPADSRAVVLRFGRVTRVQEAGLLLAWPRPIEQVRLLPAGDRQTEMRITVATGGDPSQETDFQIHQPDDVVQIRDARDAWNGSYLVTGDGSVVEFDSTLFYRISDPAAYALMQEHVEPALQRLYLASAVALAAGGDLDDFLVARPEAQDGPNGGDPARREALRGQLVQAINARLASLRRAGADLGVECSRIDVLAVLPPVAKAAFDEVLTAAQIADQNAAAARTDAAHTAQQAERDHDRVVGEAAAAADERSRTASADTAALRALESQITPATRTRVLADTYRERVATVLRRAGSVTTVDPATRLILPGPP